MKKNTYKSSGVDIDAGNQIVNDIKLLARKTKRTGEVNKLGDFASIFDLKHAGYKDPLIVSSTDGVGTKLLIASELDKYDTIGIDLVAMCVNDLIVQGADPLFFLDYIAIGKLDKKLIISIMNGIIKGCEISGCALSGGETAELPDMYNSDKFDLAGFAIGAVERENLITKDKIKNKNIIIGIPSSGFHSNGYSLIRKIIISNKIDLNKNLDFIPNTLGEELLIPTKIYVPFLKKLNKYKLLNGIAHITGGGLTENIPRVLPDGKSAKIFLNSWEIPEIFNWIKEIGYIPSQEMLKTFNCGIGMVLIIDEQNYNKFKEVCDKINEKIFIIGEIENDDDKPKVIYKK
ncbi:MAG: phosphoribosylformylglycinamidine cyclo-ligase [Rhodospirillaceae bacterium]|nr:phosphoribosylformylglycinamidine cyclo-ligase [Rhodospirillaceae bacterium]|tara:strand:- start:76287 stop:77324 length:1038 start_codon:yes stop_codon:yes gene_type:complete